MLQATRRRDRDMCIMIFLLAARKFHSFISFKLLFTFFFSIHRDDKNNPSIGKHPSKLKLYVPYEIMGATSRFKKHLKRKMEAGEIKEAELGTFDFFFFPKKK